MAWRDFAEHMKATHPDVQVAQDKWSYDTLRVWRRAVLPWSLLWVAVVAVLVFIYEGRPPALLVLPSFAAMVALWLWAPRYASGVTQGDMQAVLSRPQYCRICDQALPLAALKAHMEAVHPREARFQAMSRALLPASALAIAALMAFVYILILPYRPPGSVNFGQFLIPLGFVMWIVLVVSWFKLVAMPRFARAREAWRMSHGLPTRGPASPGALESHSK